MIIPHSNKMRLTIPRLGLTLAIFIFIGAEFGNAQSSRSNRHASDPGTLFTWGGNGSIAGLDEPIVTDRPDFTEASSVVGLGVLQLESGYTYAFNRDATTNKKSHSIGEPLFRYGILRDWLELRVAWNFANEKVDNVRATGGEDLYLGFKVGLTPQEGILPEMALVPQMTVPSGSKAFTNDELLPGCNWLYGWDINDFLATGGSTQVNRAVDGGTKSSYTEWAQSWTIGYSLTERLGGYTEWFALLPSNAITEHAQHYFDGGLTFLLTDDIQWDIRGGVGLNDAADDYFAGSGLSIRFK